MPVPPATFRPAYGRCYLLFLLPCLVGILLAAVVDPYSPTLPMPFHVWVGGEIAAMVGAAVGILVTTSWMQDRLTITVTAAGVSGPGTRGWHRPSFPLEAVDCQRSSTSTRWQRLCGYRYLWSTDGQKITINTWAFSRIEVAHMLVHVGCGTERAAQ